MRSVTKSASANNFNPRTFHKESIMSRIVIAAALFIAYAEPATSRAEDALPAALAPYVDDQTIAVGRIDLARVDLDVVFKQIVAISGDEKAAAASKQMATAAVADLRKAGVGVMYGVVSMADISGNPAYFVLPVAEADSPKVIEALKKILGVKDKELTIEAKGGAVIAAAPTAMTRIELMKPAARADLAGALASNKDAAIHIAFAPNTDLRRVAEETMPNLPKEVGGGSIQLLSRGLTWATLSLDTTPKLNAALAVQAADAATAKKMDELARDFVKALGEHHGTGERQAMHAAFAALLKPTIEGDRLVVRIDDVQFNKLATEVAKPMRASASRMKSANNLKQIALAMHNYADVNKGRFPADIVDKDGKPLLSWRVHLLPYLEQDQIYRQFKLDEPWDSPNNKPLIAKIPAVFAPPTQKSAAGTTTYLGPLGDSYLFRPKAKEGLKLVDITDGTSNTIMIVEAADAAAVEWTKPGDWTPDEKEPLKALIGHYPEGFQAAFCDGHVHFFSKKVDAKTLFALLTTAGGEVIGEIP
jgi:hypothetical protein